MHQKYTIAFSSNTNLVFMVTLKFACFSISFSSIFKIIFHKGYFFFFFLRIIFLFFLLKIASHFTNWKNKNIYNRTMQETVPCWLIMKKVRLTLVNNNDKNMLMIFLTWFSFRLNRLSMVHIILTKNYMYQVYQKKLYMSLKVYVLT